MYLHNIVEPGSGCHPDASDRKLFRRFPMELAQREAYLDVQSFEYDGSEDAQTAWAVMVRTARCCGTDYVVHSVHADYADADGVCDGYVMAHPRAALCDSEWNHHGENGWIGAPASAIVVELPIVG